jgi:hypothetical protein
VGFSRTNPRCARLWSTPAAEASLRLGFQKRRAATAIPRHEQNKANRVGRHLGPKERFQASHATHQRRVRRFPRDAKRLRGKVAHADQWTSKRLPPVSACERRRRPIPKYATRKNRTNQSIRKIEKRKGCTDNPSRNPKIARVVYGRTADTPNTAALHHGPRGCAVAVISGLVLISPHAVARVPAGWQCGAASSCASCRRRHIKHKRATSPPAQATL